MENGQWVNREDCTAFVPPRIFRDGREEWRSEPEPLGCQDAGVSKLGRLGDQLDEAPEEAQARRVLCARCRGVLFCSSLLAGPGRASGFLSSQVHFSFGMRWFSLLGGLQRPSVDVRNHWDPESLLESGSALASSRLTNKDSTETTPVSWPESHN